METQCIQQDCNKKPFQRSLCRSHYYQFQKLQQEPTQKRRVGILEPERFWQYVEKTSTCWNWIGGCSENGYGVFATGSRTDNSLRFVSAHRYAVAMAGETLEFGMQVDHLCKNRKCVNPKHLEQVTSHENTMRSNAASAVNARKLECLKGHPFNEVNTYVSKRGSRHCRECSKLRTRKARQSTERSLVSGMT